MTSPEPEPAARPPATGAPPLLLLVEDELPMRRLFRAALGSAGYRLLEAETGAHGLTLAAERLPDLVLLDLGLPDCDGKVFTAQLREWAHMPIIVVSARNGEREKIEALDAGANDYVTKPFSMGVLLARIRVALRTAARTPSGAFSVETGDVKVDLSRRLVLKGQAEVHLTRNEYKLLVALVQNLGGVVTRRQLLEQVWGPRAAEDAHYLSVLVAQLRHKLEADPNRPALLLTEPGVGYRLRVTS